MFSVTNQGIGYESINYGGKRTPRAVDFLRGDNLNCYSPELWRFEKIILTGSKNSRNN